MVPDPGWVPFPFAPALRHRRGLCPFSACTEGLVLWLLFCQTVQIWRRFPRIGKHSNLWLNSNINWCFKLRRIKGAFLSFGYLRCRFATFGLFLFSVVSFTHGQNTDAVKKIYFKTKHFTGCQKTGDRTVPLSGIQLLQEAVQLGQLLPLRRGLSRIRRPSRIGNCSLKQS